MWLSAECARGTSGRRQAFAHCLQHSTTYSLPRLPANPYFFVATQLSAHRALRQLRLGGASCISLRHTSDTRRESSARSNASNASPLLFVRVVVVCVR